MAGKGKPGPAPTGAKVKTVGVALRPDQIDSLKAWSGRSGVSLSHLLRAAVDVFLERLGK